MTELEVIDATRLRSATHTADAVIVGSGPAGAAVARELARAGMRVIVAEEGEHVRPGQVFADGLSSMAQLYRSMGATITSGRAPMPYLQGRAIGGTSVVNGAISWRLPRDIHEEWVRADPELERALPYDAIEGVTCELESILNIQVTAPGISGRNNDLLAQGAEALGVEHRPIFRNVSGCLGLGRCLQGCPEGRKTSMDQTLLPEAARHGASIISGLRIRGIEIDSGRAQGVFGSARDGSSIRLRAPIVVLGASAIGTPVLLQRSGATQGPVGQHFSAHPGVSMAGFFDSPVRVWSGATQGHEVIGLRAEGLKFEALGFDASIAASRLDGVGRRLAEEIDHLDHWAHWGAAVRAEALGRVARGLGGRTTVRYTLTRRDCEKMRRGLSVLGQMMLAAGARHVSPGVHGFDSVVSDPERMKALEREGPLDARAYTPIITHMFGTARMGADPRTSVVGHDFQHHHVKDLYVADSSVFPSNTGVNPQTSILALATLCARRIAERRA